MNRKDVENIITEYVKPVYGFALKRCKSMEDAEDLSQEIIARAFRALLVKEDIADMGKFIWTVAHNALSNYYRDTAKSMLGVPLDEVVEQLADPDSELEKEDDEDSIRRLQGEIAYLSKLQRRIIIAYYFENRKQAEIAEELNIPVGTVKWHLFEAKKELKRGMDTMRKTSELKFNPITFDYSAINGSICEKSPEEIFRSPLPQNICYCVRSQAMSVNEIADALGVSPVYVEPEVEFLEEYGFLKLQNGKYIADFIIDEPTEELMRMVDAMYKEAAGTFANDLYDEVMSSGILEDEAIWCAQSDNPVSLEENPKADKNFLLWTLIPYITACSGEKLRDRSISFEEAATIRPDGSQYIYQATVLPDNLKLPEDYVEMKQFCGPLWNGNGRYILWQIDSEWSDRGVFQGFQYGDDARRVLSLYEREKEGELSKDEYTWLAERGYVKTNGDYDGMFKSAWQIVILDHEDIRDRLLAIGERLKEKHQEKFQALKAPYAEAVLKTIPAHLRKIREYDLQFVFHTDGLFLLHGMVALLKNGKLKLPTEGQKKALTTLIVKE